ncbi:hypothetical protein M514_21809 [Trichuris suis]|uniref:Uncharacterized protein n=1 Tax=Trichuris suis TaxID=68888 RepID=A0A085N940_9BILA|nr:hypothetical protein M514_21809 [Trichuris suis]
MKPNFKHSLLYYQHFRFASVADESEWNKQQCGEKTSRFETNEQYTQVDDQSKATLVKVGAVYPTRTKKD